MINKVFSQIRCDLNTIYLDFKKKDIWFFLCLTSFFSFSLIYLNFLALVDIGNLCFIAFCLIVMFTCFVKKRFPLNWGTFGLILYVCLVFFINLVKGVFSLSPLVPPIAMLFTYIFVSIFDGGERGLIVRAFYISLLILLIYSSVKYLPDYLESRHFLSIYDNYFGNLDGLTDYIAILFGLSLYFLLKKEYFQIPVSCWCLVFIGISERRTALLLCILSFLAFTYCLIPKNRKYLFLILCPLVLLFSAVTVFFVPVFDGVKERLLEALFNFFSYSAAYSGDARGNIVLRGFYYCFTNFFGGYGYDQYFIVYGNEPAHDLLGDLSLNYGGFFAITTTLFFSAVALNMLFKTKDDPFLPKFMALYYFCFIVLGTFVYDRSLCIAAGVTIGFLGTYKTKYSELNPLVRDSVSI